ncbi:MAG: ROK family transcriptional regulator, partial [Janthinobacterium lividum]
MKKRRAAASAEAPFSQTPSTEVRELAYVEVASSELTRDINRDIILERIRSMQPISRVDLARASRLQPSTVSSIVERLLQERWIRESAIIKTARGRRPTLLSLNDDMVLLVADIRPTQAIAAVIDLNGRFLERQTVPLRRDPGQSLEGLVEVMQQFRQLHPNKTFQGVGISLPGRVDPATNRLLFAPNLPWTSFPIQERLHELLGMEVQLENAANASLLAELWFGRIDGIRNAMLVNISEGIGAAILADGRLICGRDGLAGEFGHIIVQPDGPACRCGDHGCWEMAASSRAAMDFYRKLQPNAPIHSMVELAGLALDGNTFALEALHRQARAIGQGLHLLNAVMSPDIILIAGDVTLFYDLVRDIIEAECRAGAMDGVGPRVVSIGDGEVSRLR